VSAGPAPAGLRGPAGGARGPGRAGRIPAPPAPGPPSSGPRPAPPNTSALSEVGWRQGQADAPEARCVAVERPTPQGAGCDIPAATPVGKASPAVGPARAPAYRPRHGPGRRSGIRVLLAL